MLRGAASRARLRGSAHGSAAQGAWQVALEQLIGAVVQRVGWQHAYQDGREAAVQPSEALGRQHLSVQAETQPFSTLFQFSKSWLARHKDDNGT